MRKIVAIVFTVFALPVLAAAAVNMNVQTCFDYSVNYNTNTSLNNYNNLRFNWCGLGISGDISKNFKGSFLADFSGNSPTAATFGGLAGLWYANFSWTVFPGSVFTAGLQDSVFGLIVPLDAFCRNVDYGVTWSQDFGGVFAYSFQVIQGELSAKDGWFDASTYFAGQFISGLPRKVPTGQLMLALTPVKGLTLGCAGRISSFDITITNTNNLEVGAEGYLTAGNDLVPGLSLSLDYVMLMNFLKITNSSTNASSFYFAADLNYTAGPVTPGFRYWVRDANLTASSTNDVDQYVAVYAKIRLSEDGYVKLEPYFEYRLTESGSAKPENVFNARLRFDYQFDFPLVKDNPEIK